mmetsp:Transcript_30018/g.65620  ORF Transcript_30018/g.65620 Transcript_30018/m.65620 type:complete len:234 (-) Transcript_30018:924-1625(-)
MRSRPLPLAREPSQPLHALLVQPLRVLVQADVQLVERHDHLLLPRRQFVHLARAPLRRLVVVFLLARHLLGGDGGRLRGRRGRGSLRAARLVDDGAVGQHDHLPVQVAVLEASGVLRPRPPHLVLHVLPRLRGRGGGDGDRGPREAEPQQLRESAISEDGRGFLHQEHYAEMRLEVADGALQMLLGHFGEQIRPARVFVEELSRGLAAEATQHPRHVVVFHVHVHLRIRQPFV